MFPYVFLGMVLCFFAGLFISTLVKRLKDKDLPLKPITPPTGGGKGEGKGDGKPAV